MKLYSLEKNEIEECLKKTYFNISSSEDLLKSEILMRNCIWTDDEILELYKSFKENKYFNFFYKIQNLNFYELSRLPFEQICCDILKSLNDSLKETLMETSEELIHSIESKDMKQFERLLFQRYEQLLMFALDCELWLHSKIRQIVTIKNFINGDKSFTSRKNTGLHFN